MLSLFKGFRSSTAVMLGVVAFLITSWCKVAPIIGSHCSFFSVADALTPLTGLMGIGAAIAACLGRSSLTAFTSSVSIMALVYHIPSFCASASWTYPNFLMKVVLPLLCMLSFIAHPEGLYAAPYVLYWFIPIAIYFSRKQTIFLQAFSATFIAHAVGSVIWLYAKNLPTAVWIGLIPVVIFERLLNAALMTAVYYGVKECVNVVVSKKLFFIKNK